jgi:hypothetical protein
VIVYRVNNEFCGILHFWWGDPHHENLTDLEKDKLPPILTLPKEISRDWLHRLGFQKGDPMQVQLEGKEVTAIGVPGEDPLWKK